VSDDLTRDRQLQEHCDPEILALRAIGEPAGTAADDTHLAACATCRQELDALTSAVQMGKQSEPLESPSPRVWTAIQTELGMGRSRIPAPAEPETPPVAPMPLRPERRRRRTGPLLVAAALVGVAGGIGATVLAQRLGDEESPPDVVAATPLDPLPEWQAQGNAQVVRQPDGKRALRVDLAVDEAPTQDPGFREVWLIDRQVSRLVSLGALEGDSGMFVVPEGLDLAEYPVVDVSFEPYDGQPAHSGDSIARGILPT
jgi:hypothetical protein